MKKKLYFLLIVILVLIPSLAHSAWLGTWAKRVKITVSNTNIDSNLTHFPLMLKLGTSVGTGSDDVSFIFDELQSDANRKKIALTKEDGTTQLYCEIEKWDDANEIAVLWVSKSDFILTADSSTVIYLYYDSSQSNNTTYVDDYNVGNAYNVWDSNFVCVYHANEQANTDSLTDSKENSYDMTYHGGPDPVTGKIAGGRDFDGTYDYFDADTDASNLPTTVGTISMWINRNFGNTEANYKTMLHYEVDSDNYVTWQWNIASLEFRLIVEIGNDYDRAILDTTEIPQNTWTHVYQVWSNSGNYIKAYSNGVLRNTDDCSGTWSGTLDTYRIGADNTGAKKFDGQLDEIQISNTIRSLEWIKADYYNQSDNLIDWDVEETLSVGSQVIIVN